MQGADEWGFDREPHKAQIGACHLEGVARKRDSRVPIGLTDEETVTGDYAGDHGVLFEIWKVGGDWKEGERCKSAGRAGTERMRVNLLY